MSLWYSFLAFMILWIKLSAAIISNPHSYLSTADGVVLGVNILGDAYLDLKIGLVLDYIANFQPVSTYLCISKLPPLFNLNEKQLLSRNIYVASIFADMNDLCGLHAAASNHGADYLFVNFSSARLSSLTQFIPSQTVYLKSYSVSAAVDCIDTELTFPIQCVSALSSRPPSPSATACTLVSSPDKSNETAYAVNLPCSIPEYNKCQLWWPVNGSELFIHGQVPVHLSPLRIKQRIIISCSWPVYSRVIIHDHVQSDDGSVEVITSSVVLEEDDIRSSYHNKSKARKKRKPHAIDITILLKHLNEPALDIYRQKKLVVEVWDDNIFTIFTTFHVNMKIVYGTDLLPPPSPFFSNIPLLASQLETRDDFGFALTIILPYATSLLEVGVHSGKFAELILQTATNINSYIGVDAWRMWPESEYEDLANDVQEVHNENYQEAKDRLSYFDSKSILLLNMTSLEAARIIVNESVDVVYIDAMHHYHAVQADITAWWPKVRPCGLLAGHDYLLDVIDETVFTVKPAVQEFARKEGLMLLQTYDEEKVAFPSWLLFKPCK